MADDYKIFKDINLINNQLDEMSGEILTTIQSDRHKIYANIIKSISNNIKNFIYDLSEPIFKNRSFDKIMNSEEFNANIKEIDADLKNSRDYIKNLKKLTKDSFNYFNLYDNYLNKKLSKVNNNIKSISLYIGEEAREISSSCQNDLTQSEDIDGSETTLNVNQVKGYASLDMKGSVDLTDEASVEVLDNSNGYLGNYHEVEVKENAGEFNPSQENRIIFKGERNTRDDLSSLTDDRPSTWIEYECCDFSDQKKEDVCKGYNVSWAHTPGSNNEPLRLNIKFTLDKVSIINWIDINPFIHEKLARIKLKEIKIASEKNGSTQTVVENVNLNSRQSDEEAGIFNFEPTLAKEIYMYFVQPKSYRTPLGHVYFESKVKVKDTSTTDFLIFEDTDVSYRTITERVPGPNANIDSPETGTDQFLWNKQSTEIVGENITKKREYFDGKRWLIGLRDIGINSYSYRENGKLLTNTYSSPEPIKRISLNATDIIPPRFYEGKTEETNYSNRHKWVRYYISINNGKTWHRIAPKSRNLSEYPHEYYINTTYAGDQKSTEILETEDKVHDVTLKVEMERPTSIDNADSYTPILENYNLKLESTVEEV